MASILHAVGFLKSDLPREVQLTQVKSTKYPRLSVRRRIYHLLDEHTSLVIKYIPSQWSHNMPSNTVLLIKNRTLSLVSINPLTVHMRCNIDDIDILNIIHIFLVIGNPIGLISEVEEYPLAMDHKVFV